jgi:hypothetical protein
MPKLHLEGIAMETPMDVDRRSLAEPYQGGDRRNLEDRRRADRDALGVWRWDQEPELPQDAELRPA